MNKLCWMVAVLSIALAPAGAWAQAAGTVTGRVVSAGAGEPIQGAQVLVRGTQRGAVSGPEGQFTIPNVPAGTQTLQVSRVGYAAASTQVSVAAGETATATIQMATDVLGLDEIVVIGYGQERRRNLTGAIASIAPESLAEVPTPQISHILEGRVSGVQVVQNSGTPGSAITVRVRGASSISAGNEPLYVIDGVPLIQGDFSPFSDALGGQDIDALADLNPSEIESMEVLKDASAAAIYGSRASNGVVLITTKKGKAGERPQINFNSYYGIQSAWRTPEFLNAAEYVQVTNEGILNYFGPEATEDIFGTRNYVGYLDDNEENPIEVQRGVDTDWIDEILEPAPISNITGSIAGGTERARYFVSGTTFQQDGIVNGAAYDRLNGRVNLDYSASDRVTLGTNVALTRAITSRQRNDNNIYGPFANAIASAPVDPVFDEDGEFNLATIAYDNPVALGRENEAEERSIRILGNAFANYEITDGLQGRVTVGLDQYNLRSRLYDSPIVGPSVGSRGEGQFGDAYANKILAEGTLSWIRDLSQDHSLSGVIGASYEDNTSESNAVTGSQFPSSYFKYLTSAAQITSGDSELTEWNLLSLFGRASYTFADRVTTTFNIRADGSSRFGENNRYGVFPSAAVLWRVSDEAWMQEQGTISDLAVRASYGRTGNQQGIGNQASRALIGGGFNYGDVPGLAPVQLGNPDLTWETTDQLNIGADIAFFDDRLGLSADYYIKNTTDLLLDRPIPLTTGFAVITENIGSMENRGVELSARAQLVRGTGKGFTWSTELNVSANDNEVTELFNDEPIPVGFANRIEEGEPLGAFFGYVTDGLFRVGTDICTDPTGEACIGTGSAFQSDETAPGDIRFRDLNGDGIINDEDRTIIGSPWPDFQGGWINNFAFRGLDLNVFFQFSQGNDIYNANRIYTDAFGYGGLDNFSARARDRFTLDNPDATEPRAILNDPNANNRDSDRFVEDGSYVRLKNTVLGYTFPSRMANRVGFSTLRLYLQGENLITWTDYSGFDPEVNYAGSSDLIRGTDFYTLPQARTYSLGVNVGF